MHSLLPVAFLFWQANPAADTGVVIVRLTDSVTQLPIAGADIGGFAMSLPRPRFFRGKTDAEGVGRVEHVGGGGYDVSVKRLGYVDWRRPLRVTVVPGSEVVLKMSLEPTASVEGRVLGEDGEALPGVTIHAMGGEGFALHGESGNDGSFKVEHLPPGNIRFRLLFPADRIKASLRTDPSGRERRSYPGSQFHPGVETEVQASPVAIAAGVKLTGFVLNARRTRIVEFSGRLIDSVSRLPLTEGEVELVPDGGGMVDETFGRRRVTGEPAKFLFPYVPPGSYWLLVYGGDRPEWIPFATDRKSVV